MNRLSTERSAQVIGCLVEGMSMRATTRITGVAKQTVVDLLVNIGQACSEYQDSAFRNLDCKVIEADEIWSFCYAKQKNVPTKYENEFGYGDVWTWTAIDAQTKLMPSWLVGERTVADCYTFLADLKDRLKNPRIGLTTDGLGAYSTVADALWVDNIDFAQLIKQYSGSGTRTPERTYNPAVCTGVEVRVRTGDPDPNHISTSYVERANLTMRMGMRRYTRLTNAFSKKIENHAHTVSLHFFYYNFCRNHQSLRMRQYRGGYKQRTPAMAAGICNYQWSLTQLAGLLD